MLIDQYVPEGKILRVGGLVFRGPCHARAEVKDGLEVIEIDAPPARSEPTRQEVQSHRSLRTLVQTDHRMARVTEELAEIALGLRAELSPEATAFVNQRRAARVKLIAREGAS